MEVSNASMYDGSTAMAEAYLMAQRVTRRDKIVVAKSVHKEYREVATTYAQHGDTEIVEIDFDESTGRVADTSALDDKTAALVVQSPKRAMSQAKRSSVGSPSIIHSAASLPMPPLWLKPGMMPQQQK